MTTMNTGPTRDDLERAARTKLRIRAGEAVDRAELEHAARVKLTLRGSSPAPVTNWGDAKNAERQNAVADLQRRAFPNGPTQGNPLFGISPNLGTPVEAPPEGTVVERFARGIVNAPLNAAKGVAGLVGDPIARAGIATGILPAEVGTQIDRNQQRFSAEYAPQGVAGAFGSGIGQVATGGIIAKGLGLAAGAGTLAAQGAEAGYQDYRQSVGPEEASTLKGLAVGGGYGLAEYVGERFGLGALLKAGDAQGFKNGVKALLQAAGVNASEEFVTQVAQNAISKTYDPNRQLLQGAGMAAGVGAVAGGVGAAAMRGLNRGGAEQAGASPPPVVPDQGSQPGAAVTSQQQAATEIPPESSASPLPVRPQAAESAQTLVGDQGQTDQRTAPPQARPVPEATETEAQQSGGSSTLDTPNVDRVSSPNPIQPTPEGEGAQSPRIASVEAAGSPDVPPQSTPERSPAPMPEAPTGQGPLRPVADPLLQRGSSEFPGQTQTLADARSSPNPTPESGRVGPPPGDVAEPKPKGGISGPVVVKRQGKYVIMRRTPDGMQHFWTRDRARNPDGTPVRAEGGAWSDLNTSDKYATAEEALREVREAVKRDEFETVSPDRTSGGKRDDATQTPPKSPANDPQAPTETPTDPPKADEPGYLDRVIQWAETKSREGRKPRPADKKGQRFGGTDVNVYDVVAVAAKSIRAGVRTVQAIKKIVREHLGTDNQEVMRRAYRLVRDSQTKDGKHDDARFELAVAELQDKAAETPAPAKATIRENTGQTPNESDTITQREALAGQLKAEAKGAGRVEKIRAAQEKRDAKRLGQAVAIERGAAEQSAAIQAGLAKIDTERKVSAVAEKAKADMKAMREDFADKAAELKAKGELGQDIRRDIVRLAKEYLDPADRGKVLTVIANARAKDPTGKNPSMTRDWFAALNKILGISEDAATRKALKELRKTVGKASAPKNEDATIAKEMLKELNESLGVSRPVDPFRSGTVRASDVKKLRTEYRDALTPIVDATRNGFSKGANGLADFIQAKIDDGRSNAFDADGLNLLRSTEGKQLDELNAEQLRVLNDAIKHVAFLSDNDNKMQFLGERRELEQVRAEVYDDVNTRWGDKTATDIGDGSGVGQSIKDLIVTDQDTLSTMIGTVAGRDSIAHKAMYEAIAKGDSDKVRFRRELVKDAQLDKWTPADIANAKKKRDIKLSGGQAKLTGAEMIDIVGLWNDPNTRPEIEKAGLVLEADRGTNDRIFFLNDADVSAIEVAMTPKERAAVDQLQKALKKGYDAANDAHEQMNGFRLPDSEKHWSRRRDISATEREVSGELGKDGQAARWIEDSGIFKDRSTSKAAIVVRDALDWVPDQLDTLAGMAHLAIPIREARRIMADPNVKTQFKRKGGANWVKTFENRLSEVSGGMIRDRSSVNSIGQRFLGFTARNKLAWRISTIVKQSLGFLQAAAAAKDKAHGARIIKQVANAKNYAPSVRKTLREEIDARSGYLAERADPAMSAMLASAANPRLRVAMTKIGRAWQAVERVGMGGMQWADANVVFGTYVATKQHLAKTKGLSGDALKDAAVWETEKIIRDSQNPTSTLDMSGLNLIGRQNSLVGFFTLFTSSSNKVRNQLRQVASDYAADPSKENAARLATTTMLSVGNTVGGRAIGMALSGATISAIVASLTGADLDEREISLFGEAVESGAELLDTFVPGGVAGDVVRYVGGRPTYSIPGGIPNFLTKTQRAAEAVRDDGMDAQTVRKILKAARASQALPDAPIDYTEKIIRGVVGDE
jgi:hypothetical protein